MYYEGPIRQRGGRLGLGDIFSVLTRQIIPIAKKAKTGIAKQAKIFGPKILQSGIGLMSDVAKKRNFKQALKNRGKRLLSEMINDAVSPPKQHKGVRRRKVNTSRKRKQTRRRDIFDK